MKKHRSYLILALLGASAAHAETVVNVTATHDRTVDSVLRRDNKVWETCKFHLELEGSKAPLLPDAQSEGCKNIEAMFTEALNKGADACSDSFDLNVRAFISNAMSEVLSGDNLYCTPAQAMLAPCNECDKSYLSVKKVTEVFSTTQIANSLSTYSDLFPKMMQSAAQYPCPELAAHRDEIKNKIAHLAYELNHSKVQAVRYTRAKVKSGVKTTNVKMGGMEKLDSESLHEEFSPIQVGSANFAGGSGGSQPASHQLGEARPTQTNNAQVSAPVSNQASNPASTQASNPVSAQASNGTAAQSGGGSANLNVAAGTPGKTPALEPRFPENVNLNRFLASNSTGRTNPSRSAKPALPQGLDVAGQMSDGRIGFVYSDPKDPSKNYVGFQVRDPKTNKLKTYAYVTSRENAEAVKKNPTLCDQYIKDAQTHAPRANSDVSALSRGNDLLAAKNHGKPTADLAQVASDSAQGQDTTPAQAGASGTGTDTGTSSNPAGNSGSAQTAATSAVTNSSGENSDSPFHISSGMPTSTGLKPNARTGLNPDAKVGLKTSDAQVSPSSASASGESPRSSVEVQAEAQKVAQQSLSISSPNGGSSTGPGSLKDHPNVGLDRGPSGTGIKSQIKPSADSNKGRDGESAATAQSDASTSDALKIGKTDSSTAGSTANASTQSGSQPQAGSQTASHRKPKPAPKKRRPKTSSSQTSQPKPTEAQKQRVSEYTTLAATSKGLGTVRYFLLNKFPNPEIGRWEIVNGKTEEIRYNMPADSSVIKDLTAHPEKLESTFINARYQFKQVKPHFLDPDVSDALQGIWQKQP